MRAARSASRSAKAVFEVIARTLPLGSVGFENKVNERGERWIWLDKPVVDRLRAMRGPGESYSDVILRLAEEEDTKQWSGQARSGDLPFRTDCPSRLQSASRRASLTPNFSPHPGHSRTLPGLHS